MSDVIDFPLTGRVRRRVARNNAEASATAEAELPAALRGTPYGVERYPTARGQVLLVAYGRDGEATIEVRIPARAYSKRAVSWLQQWVRAIDEKALVLVPDEREQ